MEKGAKTVRAWIILTAILGLLITGCHTGKSPDLPKVIKKDPSLTEIVQAINDNSRRIQTLRSDNVSFGMSSIAGWTKCQLAFARPAKMRMIASVSMQGSVFDCGCNDELFWMWNKYQSPSQLYWCRFADISNSFYLNQNIPFDPSWFPEALGIVEFQPNELQEGPQPQMDGTLLIIAKKQHAQTVYRKHIYVEPLTAAVKKQEIYDPNGQKLLAIQCTEFQFNQEANVVLPKKIIVTCPQNKESIHLDLGTFAVNAEKGIGDQLFVMPKSTDLDGNPPLVNLKNGNINLPAAINNTPTNTPINTPTAQPAATGTSSGPVQVPSATPTTNTVPVAATPSPAPLQTPSALQTPAASTAPAASTIPATSTAPAPGSTPVPVNSAIPVNKTQTPAAGVTAHLRTQVTN